MARRSWSLIIGVWLLTLVAVAAVAQSRAITPLSEPITISGSDIAFRVEGIQGSAPVGKLIVRYNGKWVEAKSAPEPVTLVAR